MASESPQLEMSPPQPDPRDQSIGASDSNKRKAEQGNGTQARTKRNRYISIAWYDMARSGTFLLSVTSVASLSSLATGRITRFAFKAI